MREVQCNNFDGVEYENNMNNVVCKNSNFINCKHFFIQNTNNNSIDQLVVESSTFEGINYSSNWIELYNLSNFYCKNNIVKKFLTGLSVWGNINVLITESEFDNAVSVIAQEVTGIPTITIHDNVFLNDDILNWFVGNTIINVSNNTYNREFSNSSVSNFPYQILISRNKIGRYVIDNNSFSNEYSSIGVSSGSILLNENSCFGKVQSNYLNILNPNRQLGISITGTSHCKVSNNTIYSNEKGFLIDAVESNNNIIGFNSIFSSVNGPVTNNPIYLQLSNNNQISYNQIFGASGGVDYGPYNQIAINGIVSRKNAITCNEIYNFSHGLETYYQNDGMDLTTNKFNNTKFGLYLGELGIIGKQINKGNIWNISGAFDGTGNANIHSTFKHAYFGNFVPNPITGPANWYQYGGNEPDYEKEGYCIESIISLTDNISYPPTQNCCTSFVDSIANNEEFIAIDSITDDPAVPPYTICPVLPEVFIPIYYAYYDIISDSSIWNNNQNYLSFINYYKNTSLGSLAEIEYKFNQLRTLVSDLNNDKITTTIKYIDSLLINNADSITINRYLDTLSAITIEKNNESKIFLEGISSSCDSLILQVDSILNQPIIHISKKLAITIRSKLMSLKDYNRVIGQTEFNELSQIANGCFSRDGVGVLFARTLLNVSSHQYYDICVDNRSVAGLNEIGSTKVFPNPASNYLNLSFDSDFFDSHKIIDIFGRVVKTGSLEKTLDISELTNGIYTLEFINSEGYVRSTYFKFIKSN
ncbi:MAG: T9SS type A sorting domain-containing protein [Saprospiraceae bacterium]|nr:T9SS type A sorting domain-containing protein [Saprospiraceae bacterium]